MLLASGAAELLTNLGGLFSGLAQFLTIIGAGIGFVIRSRIRNKNEKARVEAAARIAKQETQKKLEDRLEAQSRDLEEQYKAQIEQARQEKAEQAIEYKAQIADLRSQNATLLERVLIQTNPRQGNTDDG